MENTFTHFVGAYHDDLKVPSALGAREVFKARLSQLAAAERSQTTWKQISRFGLVGQRAVYLLGTFVLAIAAVMLWPSPPPSLAWSPNPQLTPGVILPVTQADVCAVPHVSRPHVALAAIGKKVFEEYGIRNPEPRHFEMDYLIDPDLGGADDARNLWPQPYSALWNANVKDALEEHLRELVCSDQITLSQAQHDISVDWIAAYKSYFHTDRPLAIHESFRKDQPWE